MNKLSALILLAVVLSLSALIISLSTAHQFCPHLWTTSGVNYYHVVTRREVSGQVITDLEPVDVCFKCGVIRLRSYKK